jgi:hypothetical protein
MRDFKADWRGWGPGERAVGVLAVVLVLLIVPVVMTMG